MSKVLEKTSMFVFLMLSASSSLVCMESEFEAPYSDGRTGVSDGVEAEKQSTPEEIRSSLKDRIKVAIMLMKRAARLRSEGKKVTSRRKERLIAKVSEVQKEIYAAAKAGVFLTILDKHDVGAHSRYIYAHGSIWDSRTEIDYAGANFSIAVEGAFLFIPERVMDLSEDVHADVRQPLVGTSPSASRTE